MVCDMVRHGYACYEQEMMLQSNHCSLLKVCAIDLNQKADPGANIEYSYAPCAFARHFNFTCDDDEEYSILLKDMPQISPSISLAHVSSIMEPKDSLIMGNEELSTIPEKELDEFIKSSV
ncbi:hypothetical protein Tco_0012803 [Tanacetum coccineum]